MLPAQDIPRAMMLQTKLTAHTMRQVWRTPLTPIEGTATWKLMRDTNSRYALGSALPDIVDVEQAISNMLGINLKGVPLKDTLLVPQRAFDMATRAAIWQVAFDRFVSENQSRFASQTELQKAASLDADSVVHYTQPAATMGERAALQKGSEWMRAMIPFSAMPMRNWAYIQTQLWTPLQAAWKAGGMQEAMHVLAGTAYAKETYGIRTGVGYKALMAYIVPAMGLALIARGRLPEDPEEFMRDLFVYNVTAVPLLGPLISGWMIYGSWAAEGNPVYMNFFKGCAESVVKLLEGEFGEAGDAALVTAMEASGFPKIIKNAVEGIIEHDLLNPSKHTDWSDIGEYAKENILGFRDY
jgi:hypothetical protein